MSRRDRRDRRIDKARSRAAAEAAATLAGARALVEQRSTLARDPGRPAGVSGMSQEPVKSAWNAHLRERFEIGGFIVHVLVSGLRSDSQEPVFMLEWGERPARLNGLDHAEFDRLVGQAKQRLSTRLHEQGLLRVPARLTMAQATLRKRP
jgi:hypothetical protein